MKSRTTAKLILVCLCIVFTIGGIVHITAAVGDTTVRMSPADAEIASGETISFSVVVEGTDDGIGAYEIRVSLQNASVGTISDVEFLGDPGLTTYNISENASHVVIEAALMELNETGNATIAHIDVDGVNQGTTLLNLHVTALGSISADSYRVDYTRNATLTVRDTTTETAVETNTENSSMMESRPGKDTDSHDGEPGNVTNEEGSGFTLIGAIFALLAAALFRIFLVNRHY